MCKREINKESVGVSVVICNTYIENHLDLIYVYINIHNIFTHISSNTGTEYCP